MILIPLITYGQGGFGVDSNKTIDNGKIRFGNGSQVSIDGNGMGRQPFIIKPGGGHIKLTYSTLPLNYAYGVGGTGTGSDYPWNTNGDVTSDLTMSNQQFRKFACLVLPKKACGVQFSILCLLRTAATAQSEIQRCGDIYNRQSMCGSVLVDHLVSP